MKSGSTTKNHPLWLGALFIVLGCLIPLGAAMSIFEVPLAVTFLLLLAGGIPLIFYLRMGFPWRKSNWRILLIWLLGCLALMVVFQHFGDERIREWRPHPAGYQIAWWVLLNGGYQLKHLFKDYQPDLLPDL